MFFKELIGKATRFIYFTTLFLLLCISQTAAQGKPIALHPENPHYFLYRGEPTVLITSAEHYGAVLNLDFDYKTYLDTLEETGMNLTRVFSGTYRENPGAFNIEKNTLAPEPLRYICPWKRVSDDGGYEGYPKFDLTAWDDAYFKRLKHFLALAAQRNVIVEYVFFCPNYRDILWDINPMNAANNVNDIGHVAPTQAYALKEEALTAVQLQFVRKAVRELNDYNNLYYEICNEPYFKGVTLEWQKRIAREIVKTERDLPKTHLIAQNIANGSNTIEQPDPHVSIFNFHYAYPPNAVAQNYALEKPIGYDESGFDGPSDTTYRGEAWAFMLAGGAIFNNLDYSFTTNYENGIASQKAPGGGSPALRQQLAVLREFLHSFDFIRMRPMPEAIQSIKPKNVKGWVLGRAGHAYAVYLRGGNQAEISFNLPRGEYDVEWIDTLTSEPLRKEENVDCNGGLKLQSPRYEDDVAVRIMNRENGDL